MQDSIIPKPFWKKTFRKNLMSLPGNGNDVAGIAHKTEPTFGLQFHPESFLSEYGKEIMQNFLRAAGTAHDGAQMASTGHALYII